MEMYKVVQGKPLNAYRNSFCNLALCIFAFSEPIPPNSSSVRLKKQPATAATGAPSGATAATAATAAAAVPTPVGEAPAGAGGGTGDEDGGNDSGSDSSSSSSSDSDSDSDEDYDEWVFSDWDRIDLEGPMTLGDMQQYMMVRCRCPSLGGPVSALLTDLLLCVLLV